MNNRIYQQTLANPCTISGVGIHTGKISNITIRPAQINTGIRFHRVDLGENAIIKADVDFVTDTSRGTTIEHKGVKVQTIEHLMAALVGCAIDNALVEIDGIETPILDGSSSGYIAKLQEAGIKEQDAKVIYYTIDENLIFEDKSRNVKLIAVPSNNYEITTLIDFESSVLGTQHASLSKIQDFNEQIAPSRTFCFLHEVESLVENNLIKGGDLNNAIVIADKEINEQTADKLSKLFDQPNITINKGILNNLDLHFPNEPARHKLLDVVGDLALSGFNINAHIIAKRPGHAANVAFAKVIKDYIKKNKSKAAIPQYDPTADPIYDINYISKTLPHKYPFLLVDKIIEMSESHIVGVKNVTMNENFFLGHFPNNPVMPGVLQIEALAQTGGILALNNIPNPEDYDTYFLKIDKVKFKQKVIPGDTLILHLELVAPIRRGICEMSAMAYVGNKVVTEASLVAQIVQRNK